MNCVLTRGGSMSLKLISSVYTTVDLLMKEADAVWSSSTLFWIRSEPARAMVVGLPGRGLSLEYVSDLVLCSDLIRRPKKQIVGYGSPLYNPATEQGSTQTFLPSIRPFPDSLRFPSRDASVNIFFPTTSCNHLKLIQILRVDALLMIMHC